MYGICKIRSSSFLPIGRSCLTEQRTPWSGRLRRVWKKYFKKIKNNCYTSGPATTIRHRGMREENNQNRRKPFRNMGGASIAGRVQKMRIQSVYKKYGGGICRKCINREYHAKLVPEDCQYYYYPYACPSCGEVRNIVVGFRWQVRTRMLFH